MTNATVLHLPESTATTITVHYADRIIAFRDVIRVTVQTLHGCTELALHNPVPEQESSYDANDAEAQWIQEICGHDASAFVCTDEGILYCAECEKEARNA